VLAVEDDRDLLISLGELLAAAGHTPVLARTGAKALARAPEADLILLDLGLPDMDGFELCRRLRADEALARVPLVILSARGDPRFRVLGLEYGADDYIAKPLDLEELLARLDVQLRVRQAEEALRRVEREADRLQAAHQLGQTLAHELNQPLAIVLGYLELLQHRPVPPDEAQHYYAEMARAGCTLSNNVKQFQSLRTDITKTYGEEMTVLDLDRSAALAHGAFADPCA
jgi:DNA-binding response OmpR family regulator